MNLQPGDHAVIIGPASALRTADRDLLPMAVSLLESWGLSVEVRVDDTHHFYLAGPDSVRVKHFHAALADASTYKIIDRSGRTGFLRSCHRNHLCIRVGRICQREKGATIPTKSI